MGCSSISAIFALLATSANVFPTANCVDISWPTLFPPDFTLPLVPTRFDQETADSIASVALSMQVLIVIMCILTALLGILVIALVASIAFPRKEEDDLDEFLT